MADRGRFLRENAFLLAAVLLPLVVIGFFLVATAIPRWVVPAPAYDLLMRRAGAYDQTAPRVAVDFVVRDERVEARVRALPAAAGAYPEIPKLFLFDHKTMNVREVPVDLPAIASEGDPVATVTISALAGRRVLAQTKAPDGYTLNTPSYSSPGLFGGLFGMGSHGEKISLVNKGRVIAITFPSPQYGYSVSAVGWLTNEGSR